jgi:hypothetical protein
MVPTVAPGSVNARATVTVCAPFARPKSALHIQLVGLRVLRTLPGGLLHFRAAHLGAQFLGDVARNLLFE